MSQIEKQFFETFGINKSTLCKYAIYGYEGEQEIWYKCTKTCEECWTYPNNTTCKDRETDYPQITDHILLMLICTLNKSRLVSAVNLNDVNYEDLKNTILGKNITILKNEFLNHEIRNEFKHQVQAIFKEVR